ncbi:hypothetical protein ACFFRR_000425 [Megaselia abdita]
MSKTKDEESISSNELSVKRKSKKLPWFGAPIFLAFWFIMFYSVVIPSYTASPKHLGISEEKNHVGEFIGERAMRTLFELTSFGDKSVGSDGHRSATQYILDKVIGIANQSVLDLYDIEVDHHISSGRKNYDDDYFIEFKDISNIVVRISPKNLKSKSTLLVNSHYDTEIDSPGAGDDASMVSILIEIFCVLASDIKPLDHPIIFLFNGAEEVQMIGSYTFLTSHKWAKDVKVAINLDSAGSGGREIVFQSGPNHPWLMEYYRKSVDYPFVSTIAEELFQRDFIPSDTDYSVFKAGGVPGLDLAHIDNGYVYHSKFDRFSIMQKRTYQLTGSNVLALIRSLANAQELDDMENHQPGNAVFFDLAGWFMVYYTETQGTIINIIVSVCALGTIFLQLLRIKKVNEDIPNIFWIIFVIQIASTLVAFFSNFLIAFIIDALGFSLTWYTNTWLIFGIYFCPVFFLMNIGQSVYNASEIVKSKPINYNILVQMVLHAHCIVLVLLLVIFTSIGIRSSFIFMISVLFYTISMIINWITKLYKRDFLWTIPHCLLQLVPFWFYTYLTYVFLKTLIPMQGRKGVTTNPEKTIAGLTALFGILFSGFILPILNIFRKTKTVLNAFIITFLVFFLLSFSPAGFPFKADTSFERYYVRHTNRMFYAVNGTLLKNDSGFTIITEDRRNYLESYLNLKEESVDLDVECETDNLCGLLDVDDSQDNYFIRGPQAEIYSDYLNVTLTNRKIIDENHLRYEVEIEGPDHILGAISVYRGNNLIAVTTDSSKYNVSQKSFYEFSLYRGHEKKTFEISIDFDIPKLLRSENENDPTFRLSLEAHHVHHRDWFSNEFNQFLREFPAWVYPTAWITQFYSREF